MCKCLDQNLYQIQSEIHKIRLTNETKNVVTLFYTHRLTARSHLIAGQGKRHPSYDMRFLPTNQRSWRKRNIVKEGEPSISFAKDLKFPRVDEMDAIYPYNF
jgi:hypothetical protein